MQRGEQPRATGPGKRGLQDVAWTYVSRELGAEKWEAGRRRQSTTHKLEETTGAQVPCRPDQAGSGQMVTLVSDPLTVWGTDERVLLHSPG